MTRGDLMPPTTARSPRRPLLLAAVAATVVVLVGGATALLVGAPGQGGSPLTAPPTAKTPSASAIPELSRRNANDQRALGKVDAPVVLIEWSDYRCPFCGVFARDTQPALVREYVDKGLLRIEWHDMPVFGDQSIDAAVAGRAAAAQGRFWQFHEKVYDVAPSRGHADLSRERLLDLARQAGVPDMAAFEATLDDVAVRADVQREQQEGYALGITGTPTFLIGSTPLVGAQPVDVFRDAIDQQLKAGT
ncbi:DsbA family protein [Leifsonia sp. SIMBA_070]|uniref:DsbA family protein n=1 Tax=Leifsonia sp. SIMBA_070 TaxID=3085810 RepID=UPI0039796026